MHNDFLSGYNKIRLNCSWGKKCLKLSMYFSILLLLSLLAYKCWPSFEPIKLNSFNLKCSVLETRYENSRFVHFYTNNFALIRERIAFICKRNAIIRESFALICESYALIRESFALFREGFALIRVKNHFFFSTKMSSIGFRSK